MERKAKLRPPSAADRHDLLRHAQAVLKRHRPLPTGLVPNLDQRTRRLASEKLRESVGSEKGVSLIDHNVEPEHMDLSLTASSSMGFMTEGSVSHNVGASCMNGGAASVICDQPGSSAKFVWSNQLNSVAEGQRSTLCSGDSAQTGSSSMLGSGSYYGGKIDYANEKNLDPCVQQELQTSGACTVGTLAENLMRKPVAQLSLSGLTFATTTSQHSVPAPLLNSTTQSAVNSVGLESIDAFKLHRQPVVAQGHSLKHFGLSNSGDNRVSQPTVVSAQVSNSAPQISVRSEDQNLSKEQFDQIKNSDGLKAVHFCDEISEGERNHAAKPCETTQASMAEQKLMPAENVKDLSNVVKTVKGTRGKSNVSSKKKITRSDLIVKVNGKLYQKLGMIGSGGSSEVYKVISSDKTIYALKMIKLKGRDYSMAYGFCQEIKYLNKLKGNNHIIQLIDYEVTNKTLLEQLDCNAMTTSDGTFNDNGHIYMVLEYGEIDLAHMLSQKWKEMNNSFEKLDENWLRFYWQQMLLAVNTIHQERIVHSDLKPANFLLVKGLLKLIDFGLAKAIMSDTTNIQRDAQMGTLNYMSPEAYMWDEEDPGGSTIKCGRPSDIWSLGCILYQMVYGRTPFSECKNFWTKFKAITDRNHQIKYGPVSNPWLLDLMKKCLAWDRDQRWRIPQLLQHPFLVPPATPQFSPSRYEHCRLLLQLAETYGNNNTEISSLCNQLHDIIATVDEDGTCITSLY